jgi:hypothetical protein
MGDYRIAAGQIQICKVGELLAVYVCLQAIVFIAPFHLSSVGLFASLKGDKE